MAEVFADDAALVFTFIFIELSEGRRIDATTVFDVASDFRGSTKPSRWLLRVATRIGFPRRISIGRTWLQRTRT
jgi:hypothetical protein